MMGYATSYTSFHRLQERYIPTHVEQFATPYAHQESKGAEVRLYLYFNDGVSECLCAFYFKKSESKRKTNVGRKIPKVNELTGCVHLA